MAIREVIQIGHPKLKVSNKIVTDVTSHKVKTLIADLADTMRQVGLIALAAPQIGENYQVFVTEPRETPTRSKDECDELRVFINPQIISKSQENVIIYEGCGSVLGQIFGPVKRPKEITVEAFNEHGQKFSLTCDGILARVIQHELDHLKGIEFLEERVADYKKLVTLEYYSAIKEDPKLKMVAKITRKEVKIL